MGLKGLILLQNTKGVYRSGEPVKGILKYSLDKPIKFTSIDISLVGKGKCQWSQQGPNNKSSIYSNKEEYVNKSKHVLEGRVVNQKLLAGTYECPFEFFLPEDIPTSFKNKTCTIAYKVIAIFAKDNFFGTKNKFEREVTVYGYVEPVSLEPLIFGLQKDHFSLPLNNKLEVKAEMERTFLTPGESIKVKLNVINDTDVPITIEAELMKYFTYISDNDIKHIVKNSVKTSKAFSPTLKGKSVMKTTCVVPTLPSLYSIQHTKVMIREYKLRLTAKLPFPHINASVEAPVVIGERRDHLGATVVAFDDGSPSSSKIYAIDEKEQTVEEYLENYDNKWKDFQAKMSRQP